jgi:uncharacterized membrane protein (Fun14 family)
MGAVSDIIECIADFPPQLAVGIVIGLVIGYFIF